MSLKEIPIGQLVVVRWKDILWVEKIIREEDIERVTPVFETVGKIAHCKRGLLVIRPEWGIFKEYEDYEGEAGNTTQIIPMGCVEAIYECKVGKKFWTAPKVKDEVIGEPGRGMVGPSSVVDPK